MCMQNVRFAIFELKAAIMPHICILHMEPWTMYIYEYEFMHVVARRAYACTVRGTLLCIHLPSRPQYKLCMNSLPPSTSTRRAAVCSDMLALLTSHALKRVTAVRECKFTRRTSCCLRTPSVSCRRSRESQRTRSRLCCQTTCLHTMLHRSSR